MLTRRVLLLSSLSAISYSQSVTPYQASSTSIPAGAGPTRTTNTSAFTTSIDVSVEDLWDMYVGPVEVAAVNITVSPTPISASELVPPPPLYYSPFPTGQQNVVAESNNSLKFPADFWWGVSSAAYQVEGAVKDEGRGPSIWDVFLHRVSEYTAANQTGDVANNQYYLYKQDIARIAALGVKAYSFSISWSRIMPFGQGPVNEQALAHYDDVIDTCLQYGVEPIVTLYHWDLPFYLQNLYGGWLSEEIIPDFTEYARLVFTRYGSKVSKWVTMNEPIVFCSAYPQPEGYVKKTSIPKYQQPYFCGQNVLLAHAKAYRIGKSILSSNASISFKTNGGYKIPLTNSSADAAAVQRAWDFNEGWFAEPTFLTGDYPASVKSFVSSFLRPFTTDEKAAMNGSSDIFMHDAYTSQFFAAPKGGIEACASNSSNPLFPTCVNATYAYAEASGGWSVGYAADPKTQWLHKAADWVPILLHYIQDTWKPRGGIAVSEFGFVEPFEELKTNLADIRTDLARTIYYREYMNAILIAMSQGVNVVGTLAWSILDNLEWNWGYTVKFGMQYCNLTSQERHFKASFFEYVNAFKQ